VLPDWLETVGIIVVKTETRKNCLILGSGRSGTSLLAGTLYSAGYHMGEKLLPANSDNPKGFFEAREVNAINETLLFEVTPPHPASNTTAPPDSVRWGWRWLADVPVGTHIPCSRPVARHIEALTGNTPFCFKDPRFCYTLPVWRPYLSDCVFLCIFRDPAHTANSIVKVCERGEYLHGLELSFDEALQCWALMYRHVLDVHRHQGDWLFLHYRQILDGSAIPRLERILNTAIKHDFADAKLERSVHDGRVPAEIKEVYRELCNLAQYPGDE
jgi:hypothetical protein